MLIVAKDLERSIEFYKLVGFDHLETINRPNDRVALMRLDDVKIEIMNLPKGRETEREQRKHYRGGTGVEGRGRTDEAASSRGYRYNNNKGPGRVYKKGR